MADNVVITAGTGTTVHADEYTHTTLGSGKTQLVKLVDGTLDAEAAIAADIGVKANALRVAPASDITDATYIGDIKFGEAEPNSAAILADTTAILADTAAIQTAVELLDNAVDGNYLNVNVNAAGVDLAMNAGVLTAQTQRVTIATDDEVNNLLGTIDADTSSMATDLGTIAGDTTSIDGKITACNTGAVTISTALPAGDNNIGNVDIASSVALDVSAATVTVDLGVNNDVVVAGDVAHDSADSGNPTKVGFKAYAFDGTAPGTAVAEADRANGICDTYGRQYVETIHPNSGNARDNQSTAQTNTVLLAAPGAGLAIYIEDIVMSTDTAMNIKLVENTGTPVDKAGPYYFAANGGATINRKVGVKLSANVNLGYTSSGAGNHTVEVGYRIVPA